MKKVNHYENFPVASKILPPHVRQAVVAIYHFARTADDFADEPQFAHDSRRIALLNDFQNALKKIENRQNDFDFSEPFYQSIFQNLNLAIQQHSLPIQPFCDLISAFLQDVTKNRYQNEAQVLAYARYSAVPVGVLMLELFQVASAENLRRSADICTALQLANFCQDVAIDAQKNRIYLPQDEMADFGVLESDILQGKITPAFRALMKKQVARARDFAQNGAALVFDLPERFGFEIRLTIQGVLRILDKIENVDFDVFHHRPTLKKSDFLKMFGRSLFQKNFRFTVEK